MRSVAELLKVCENQPVSRVGRSDMRDDDEGVYIDIEGWMSEMVLRGRSGRVRARGMSIGSMITGGSSNESSCSPPGSGGLARSSLVLPEPSLFDFLELGRFWGRGEEL